MSDLTSSQGTAPTSPTPEGGFFRKFINTIKREINDLSYVEIVTAAGDPKTDVNPDAEDVILGVKALDIKILARTRIELDGDIMVLLPTEKGSDNVKINQEIMAIHKENVDTAVENWNKFINNILAALNLLMDITGLSKPQALASFNQPVSTTNSPTASTTTSGSTTTTTTEPAAASTTTTTKKPS